MKMITTAFYLHCCFEVMKKIMYFYTFRMLIISDSPKFRNEMTDMNFKCYLKVYLIEMKPDKEK